MSIRIALAGNPNCGKTTLFNALTGSSQYVGNWPGVTVEKKDGALRNHKDVIIQDLPGIYSLSPYTPEEIVSRTYLVEEHPDAILNIVDGTNIERNLYLTTQLVSLGIPIVVAINMMDVVEKNGDRIDIAKLSKALRCPVVKISALEETGLDAATEAVLQAAATKSVGEPPRIFKGSVEHAIAHIEESLQGKVPDSFLRWYSIKVFEQDEKILAKLALDPTLLEHIREHIRDCEQELDDDAASLITDQRYDYVKSVVDAAVVRKPRKDNLSTSDRIDRIVTNRWAAIPVFAIVVWLMYFISVQTVGGWLTDWANDGVFGEEGWFVYKTVDTPLFCSREVNARRAKDPDYTWENVAGNYQDAARIIACWEAEYCKAASLEAVPKGGPDEAVAKGVAVHVGFQDEETGAPIPGKSRDYGYADYLAAKQVPEPSPSDFGLWVPSLPRLAGRLFDRLKIPDGAWGRTLIFDVLFHGVGTVLGFVPQIIIIFLFMAFLEDCGYMARVAFIMDRLFRSFGLSGKSFIPMLIGMGCGVPAIMATRTIESDRDRRMTIMLATSIPCGAKYAIIALFVTAFFGGNAFVATAMYLVGIAVIVIGGLVLKKCRAFAGEPIPFVMELPSYHMPSATSILRHTWERTRGYVVKAGTIIFAACVVTWFLKSFNWRLQMVDLEQSILRDIGASFAWIFKPLGFGNWKGAVSSVVALIAKEQAVANLAMFTDNAETVGKAVAIHQLFDAWNAGLGLASLAGLSFMLMNLWNPPCIAAIATMWREMGDWRWGVATLVFQMLLGYFLAFVTFQLGAWLFYRQPFTAWTAVALALVAALLYLIFRPAPKLAGKAPKA